MRQYTKAEIEAFVEVADTYNIYVASHTFTDDAVRISVEAGVKSIEHGFLMSRETMELMRNNDVWLSICSTAAG